MARKISDSVIVVTGASSGIGRATALRVAREGGTVVVTARRKDALERLAEQCERLGGRVLAFAADVTNEKDLHALARKAVETFGRIDAWVNNAAVTMFARIEEAPMDAFRKVIEINLFGYVHGTRAVLPYFREQGSGTLINVSSMVAHTGQPYVSAYAITKSAIVGLSNSVRMELRDAPGIHVCTILPASIDTPLFHQGANFTGRAVKPMNPVYSAEDVAQTILAAVESPSREVAVGNSGRMLMLAHTLSPMLSEKMLARQVDKDHFQDRAASPSEGNLFKPMDQYESVSGGWRGERTNGKHKGRMLLLIALGIGMGILAGKSSRPRYPQLEHRTGH